MSKGSGDDNSKRNGQDINVERTNISEKKPLNPYESEIERLKDENKELKAKNDKVWAMHNEFLCGPYTDVQKEVHALRAEIDELRKFEWKYWDLRR